MFREVKYVELQVLIGLVTATSDIAPNWRRGFFKTPAMESAICTRACYNTILNPESCPKIPIQFKNIPLPSIRNGIFRQLYLKSSTTQSRLHIKLSRLLDPIITDIQTENPKF